MKKIGFSLLLIFCGGAAVLCLCPAETLPILAIYTWLAFFSLLLCLGVLKISGGWYTLSRRVRGLLWSKGKNTNLLVDECVRISNRSRVCIGKDVVIGKNVDIFPVGGNYPSKVKIGNRVMIGDYNRFACCDTIEIGDDVLFAAYVHITDHSHEFKDVTKPVSQQGIFSKGPVKIGNGSWLGYRSEVLSGVTIGEHCVIASGAVVTKDIPSYSVAAGVPARVIKAFDFEKKEWVNV